MAFFSRGSLQRIGSETVVVKATGGFGRNSTVTFRDAVPAGVLRYDMFISLTRFPSLDVQGCTFEPGGRGLVVSASPVRIVGNNFSGLVHTAVLFLNGG